MEVTAGQGKRRKMHQHPQAARADSTVPAEAAQADTRGVSKQAGRADTRGVSIRRPQDTRQANPGRTVADVMEILQQRHRPDGSRQFFVRWHPHTSYPDEWQAQDFFFNEGVYADVLLRYIRMRRTQRGVRPT